MDIFVIISAFFIGAIMGLIGGGGSILTVPVMVYLVGVNPILATAYSLFVVGVSAVFGAINNVRKKMYDLKIAILFAIPSFIAVYLVRRLVIPILPEYLINTDRFTLTSETGIMIFFAFIMTLAALSMLGVMDRFVKVKERKSPKPLAVLIEGGIVGAITGLVGAGGGFLIIPALVLLAGLPMKTAVGTSLIIISVKSLIGFLGDLQSGQLIEWIFLLKFTGISIIGILVGGYFSDKISNKKLKIGFGCFVLVMAGYIIYKEVISK